MAREGRPYQPFNHVSFNSSAYEAPRLVFGIHTPLRNVDIFARKVELWEEYMGEDIERATQDVMDRVKDNTAYKFSLVVRHRIYRSQILKILDYSTQFDLFMRMTKMDLYAQQFQKLYKSVRRINESAQMVQMNKAICDASKRCRETFSAYMMDITHSVRRYEEIQTLRCPT